MTGFTSMLNSQKKKYKSVESNKKRTKRYLLRDF